MARLIDTDATLDIGELVLAAYNTDPADLTNLAGHGVGADYAIVSTVYAHELATDATPQPGPRSVSVGFVCQNPAGHVVVALRGTDAFMEWLHDSEFHQTPFTVAGTNVGFTDDGLTTMYNSLTIGPDSGAPDLVTGIHVSLPFPHQLESITLCGTGLGAALVTMLAVDLFVRARLAATVYTFGSPRVGDATFAAVYERVVPNSFRIANRLDIVTTLPPSPPYQHGGTLVELVPASRDPFDVAVATRLECEHHPGTYLYLLSGGSLPLPDDCKP